MSRQMHCAVKQGCVRPQNAGKVVNPSVWLCTSADRKGAGTQAASVPLAECRVAVHSPNSRP